MSMTSFPELADHLSKPENARRYGPSAVARKRHVEALMAGPWGESVRAWERFDAGDATDVLDLERRGVLFPRSG